MLGTPLQYYRLGHVDPTPNSFRHAGTKSPAEFMTERAVTPILIVAYRNSADIVACLTALRAARPTPAFEIFLCENGGSEAYRDLVAALTAENGPCLATGLQEEELETPLLATRLLLRLKGRADAPLVHVGEAKENLGYAGGVNAWLRPLMAVPGWPAAWILNPDTEPAPDALSELSVYAVKWGKGMVGSRLVPTAQSDSVHSRGLRWSKSRAIACSVDLRAPGDIEPDPKGVDSRLDSPSGASMYVTRRCIEQIGLMDEDYFLFFEDLEWGLRAKRLFGVGYAHRSVVVHAGGTTIGSSINDSRQSALSVYLEHRNCVLFVQKNFPRWLLWTVVLRLVRLGVKGRVYPPGNLTAAICGIVAGVRGRVGRPNGDVQNQRTAGRRRG
jgi:N-acetylglucosaminyl-diphospho-decaprenol L-rhamnosyltransferase